MSSEWLLAQLKEHFGTEEFWVPTLIVLFFIGALFNERLALKKILEPYPRFFKNAMIVSSFAVAFLIYNRFIWNSFWLSIAGGSILLLLLLSILVRYLLIERSLKEVISVFNSHNLDYQEVNALQKIKSLSPDKMTAKQKIRYERYKMYVLIQLGNLRSAQIIVEKLGIAQLGDAHYYFLKYIVAFYSGDIGRAHEEIKKAVDARNNETEPTIQVEILVNQGVSYVSQKNYHAADDSFYQATQEYKRLELNNKTLLYIIYKNYAFNKTRLEKSNQSIEAVVSEYKTLLDFNCYSDQIDYFNLELEMLRQKNASRDVLNKVVQDNFSKMLEGSLPLRNKVMFAGSVIRIVWSAMLDPTQCLNILNDNYRELDSYHPMFRYRVNKELTLLFRDLHGEIPEMYTTLRDNARTYMVKQAEDDITIHRKALPDEAVFERCYCFEELAGIERKKQDYSTQKVISFLGDAVKLCQDNSLLMDEIKSRLNIMDELCAFENWNENFVPLNPEEMRQQRYRIESLLPKLKKHPIRAEIGIRMSFYCLLIHEYDKCIEYYDWFDKASLSLNHFAPWLHQYRMSTAFAVRILHLKKIIVALKDSQEVMLCEKEVQEWFRSYPNHDGFLDSVLLARFIGYSQGYPIKTLKWSIPNSPEQPRRHTWFYFPELQLNADITYEQFIEEDNYDQLFFNFDRHPFESNESRTIAKDVSQAVSRCKEINFIIGKYSDLSPAEKELFSKVYDLINKHIPANCPSQVELKELFSNTMMPIPAIE